MSNTNWKTEVLHTQPGTARGRRWSVVKQSVDEEPRILSVRGSTARGPSHSRVEVDLTNGKAAALADLKDLRRAIDSIEKFFRG